MTSQSEKPGQGRAVLLLIVGIPLTMMLAASWLWYFVVEGDLNLVGAIGTANNGTLISPPRELQQVEFSDDAGRPFRWDDLEPRCLRRLRYRRGLRPGTIAPRSPTP